MKNPSKVLISWIAVNTDPYERDVSSGTFRLVNGSPVPGPTLTALFDEDSPYREQIRDVVLLHGKGDNQGGSREQRAVAETVAAIRENAPGLRVHLEAWPGKDPTDHQAIFAFLQTRIPNLRKRFADRELVIHISPGTPSMQTIWVLMAETGFVAPPFRLIKSYRRKDRKGRGAVADVSLGLDTFYKAYKASRPLQVSADEQSVILDPGRFRTEKMRRLFAEARRFARLNVPLLIHGERGTGKTTLAAWVRLNSPFRRPELDHRWPCVACGQYSPETMRAELFGYKKGAFTGALKDREGLLAAADGDTLFLDEVGDVSRELQRLLIKALEEKQYHPLGDDHPRKSDFRLLTATNIDQVRLKERLDPDFLDRISLMTLHIPPLREIRDEMPWLWEAVFEQARQRSGLSISRTLISEKQHRRMASGLMHHPLPGNLRDLFRAAYRLIAARSDPDEPLSPDDAIDYALECLETTDNLPFSGDAVSKDVARAFAESKSLDSILEKGRPLPSKHVEADLKAFMAGELKRYAKRNGLPLSEISDVTERTLRTWLDRKG